MSIRVTISGDVTGLIANLLTGGPERIARDSARRIAADASRRAPVDTGELRDSIRASGSEVIVGAEHGVYQEYGTVFMPPQPFLAPAVEAEAARFGRSLLRLFAPAGISASPVDVLPGDE